MKIDMVQKIVSKIVVRRMMVAFCFEDGCRRFIVVSKVSERRLSFGISRNYDVVLRTFRRFIGGSLFS